MKKNGYRSEIRVDFSALIVQFLRNGFTHIWGFPSRNHLQQGNKYILNVNQIRWMHILFSWEHSNINKKRPWSFSAYFPQTNPNSRLCNTQSLSNVNYTSSTNLAGKETSTNEKCVHSNEYPLFSSTSVFLVVVFVLLPCSTDALFWQRLHLPVPQCSRINWDNWE